MKKIKMNLAGTKVVEKWKVWVCIPLIVIILACVAFGIYAGVNQDASRGINLGIDFTGGNIVTVQFKENLTDATYKEHVETISNVIKEYDGVVSYDQKGGEDSVIVRFGLLSKDNDANEILNNAIMDDIATVLDGKIADGEDAISLQYNGPSASRELILTAVLSVVISTLLILIYIVFRFRNIYTGLSAIIALLHDVIIVTAMTIICHIQINSSFIAALITIIAYSINNTIVLFDRARDNYKKVPLTAEVNHNYVVNKSVAQTLSRSILTTITTMAAIVILAIIGVASIREFALPVIFGLIAGGFSSIFLAPSLYCLMKNASDKAKKNKTPKAPKPKKIKKAKVVEEA